jgi:hypothetical protein
MSWYKSTLGKVKNYASSFWYDDYDTSFDYLEEYGSFQKKDLDAYKKTHNLYKLASVRRAISNFVQIVTNKPIPVSFATKSESMTDGEKVILSADVEDNFDVSVGLALHEGSHIILSDFNLLTVLNGLNDTIKNVDWIERQNAAAIAEGNPPLHSKDDIQKFIVSQLDQRINSKYRYLTDEIMLDGGKIGKYGIPTEEVLNIIKGLTNWIEDRRIDHYIYNSAPGYRDYYVTMYEHYFNDKAITKGVKSDEFTDETWESYMFRIINLMNENTDLKKLKGLRNIYRILNLKNVSRLKNSSESLSVAIDVVAEILNYVPMKQVNQQQQGGGKGNGNSETGEPQNGQGGDVNETGDDKDQQMGGMNGAADVNGDNSTEQTDGNASDAGKELLSKSAADQLAKKFKKQKDFLNGDIKKKKITKQESDKLDDIQESGTEMVRVGNDYVNTNGERIGKGVDCIVVKKLTKSVFESDDFPFTQRSWRSDGLTTPYIDEVKRGTMLGTLLGKKLQIRSESRDTIFNRLKKGKIDGRLIASLGFDNENVFYTKETDQYKKANLHISIDYSGSMSGEKIRKAITSTVAIVKACEMARNINVQVSIRSTDTGRTILPYVAMVYDSRRDTFKQFCTYMSSLECTNTTPEGLCFEAILKQLIPTTNDTDSYFLNFSDGQPTYSINQGDDSINYSGSSAAEHTRRQVKKMQNTGMNILSYFITDYGSDRFENSSDWQIFKKCYGNDAKYVNVENMFEVAKTMNELFLKKSNNE